MCTTCHHASANLKVRLKNPNQTISIRVTHRPHSISFMAQPINRTPLHFETQITKPELSVLKLKLGNPSTLVWRVNQETRAPRLYMYGAYRKRCHPTSRSSRHQVSNLWLIIPGPLHQVFYSCLDYRRCPSCRTCHIYTTR
jgi:hypothetical protein